MSANYANFLIVYKCIYNSYAHVAMYPLFALMLPDWRSMHYILHSAHIVKIHTKKYYPNSPVWSRNMKPIITIVTSSNSERLSKANEIIIWNSRLMYK